MGRHLSYPLLCIGLGAALGWIPYALHGPIPDKFNVLYIRGSPPALPHTRGLPRMAG